MIYVTGITGHSGRWFLKRLEEEEYPEKIRVVMRNSFEDSPEKYELFNNSKLALEFAVGDLTDEVFLRQSLVDVDTVIHIATINLSSKLIDAAVFCGVKWAILVHTTGRFSRYKSASEGYIRIEERILSRRNQISITVLRPTMIYGSSSDQNMFKLVRYLDKHRLFPLFGDGSNLMQPVHARDLGNAYYEVMVNKEKTMNKEYNLSGKNPIKYIEIIKWVKAYLNSKVHIVSIPFGVSVVGARVYNFLFGASAIISVEQVLRMQEDKVFSYAAAAEDFGYSPVSFEEGIKEEVEEYLQGSLVKRL